jgi:hypothetical protein
MSPLVESSLDLSSSFQLIINPGASLSLDGPVSYGSA